MKAKTYQSLIKILSEIKELGISVAEYYRRNAEESLDYFYVRMSNVKKDREPSTKKLREELLALYEEVKSTKKTSTSKEIIDSENHVEVSYERNEEGKILYYNYKIYKRYKPVLDGKLSREEMAKIMRLYTYEGGNFTARVVSREFPQFSLQDLKRIFRAFVIFKDNCPFAPHDVEEKTIDELRAIQLREKENDFMRRAEEDRIRNNEKLLKKYAQENIELRQKLEDTSRIEVVLPKDIKPISIPEYEEVGQSINLYLSDFHLGSYTTSGSLFDENQNYGFEEAKRRLSVVLEKLSAFDCFDTINLVLMGDMIDCCGHTGYTNSMTHIMPNNMDAREQGNKYIELLSWFIESLINNKREFTSKIRVFSVPAGNHGGNYEYMATKALMYYINAKYPDIETTVWEQYYGCFQQNNHVFYIMHGRHFEFMKKGMPLLLDNKTQNLLYEWLMEQHETRDNIHFVKGDLHSNSLTSCKRFDYRNVLSLYGASDYSNLNYSRNSWGVSYDLMIGDNLIRGTFENM